MRQVGVLNLLIINTFSDETSLGPSKCPYSMTITQITMRKIESQIIDAIQNNRDLKIANSEVISCTNVSDVYLHGNLIARIGETWMELFDCGYQTKTTKSRLNALLSAFGMEGEYIFQKKGKWFLNYDGATIPFFNGMRLA